MASVSIHYTGNTDVNGTAIYDGYTLSATINMPEAVTIAEEVVGGVPVGTVNASDVNYGPLCRQTFTPITVAAGDVVSIQPLYTVLRRPLTMESLLTLNEAVLLSDSLTISSRTPAIYPLTLSETFTLDDSLIISSRTPVVFTLALTDAFLSLSENLIRAVGFRTIAVQSFLVQAVQRMWTLAASIIPKNEPTLSNQLSDPGASQI